ncbi:MAG: hypothetical protein JJU06_21395 [Ectothiorhodospiraceae bacterium]|nr:hypothetical protein [Ectothiorhodospiraceae bacterium]
MIFREERLERELGNTHDLQCLDGRLVRVADKLNELQTESLRLQKINQQRLNALAELKQSLLQKTFSGELTADAADVEHKGEAALA